MLINMRAAKSRQRAAMLGAICNDDMYLFERYWAFASFLRSYADLITNAIMSSPEKRLTLSQGKQCCHSYSFTLSIAVYEWMVQNVPYFRDKGDSNSSAGWKVRRRHFLFIIISHYLSSSPTLSTSNNYREIPPLSVSANRDISRKWWNFDDFVSIHFITANMSK
jgi:hypothetical protein